MILPAIVSMEQMASVQIHKLRLCVLKPFLPALWLAAAAGAPGQRRWPQWAAPPSAHPKSGSRGPSHPKETAALVGPHVGSSCVDNGQEGVPTEINGKTHMARTSHGCLVGAETTVLQPSQREWETTKTKQTTRKTQQNPKANEGFCCEVLNWKKTPSENDKYHSQLLSKHQLKVFSSFLIKTGIWVPEQWSLVKDSHRRRDHTNSFPTGTIKSNQGLGDQHLLLLFKLAPCTLCSTLMWLP